MPIHPEMEGYIRERVESNLPGAWLFPNPRTGDAYSVQALRKIWDKVRKQIGVNGIRIYDVGRHSVASELGAQGVDINQIANLLGHSSIRTTRRYVHPDLQAKKMALEKLTLRKVLPFDSAGELPVAQAQSKIIK